jgi:hypothetical protein
MRAPGWLLLVFVLAGANLAAGPAWAAPGPKPGRVELGGYDPVDRKVFFRIYDDGESPEPPRAYYFALGSASLGAVRARSLEGHDSPFAEKWNPPAWQALRGRLVVLAAKESFDLCTSVRAEPPTSGEADPAHRLRVSLSSANRHAERDLRATCYEWVAVRGLYRIPGRGERVARLHYSGPACLCDASEELLLLE